MMESTTLEWHAAEVTRILAGNDLVYLPFPMREPLLGMGHEAVSIRQSQFELPDSSSEISHASFPLQRRDGFDASAARSNSDTRASISSISIALAAWPTTDSAARRRLTTGASLSSMILRIVETAAPDACCKRAVA